MGKLQRAMPIIVPIAAALLMFYLATAELPKKATRVEGAAAIDLLGGPDGGVVFDARPGEALQLKLLTGGFTHALVLSVDKDRNIELLWPLDQDGAIGSGQSFTVPRRLEAPAWSIVVHAFFGRAPLDAKATVASLELALRDYGGWPLEAKAPVPAGGAAASAKLHVTAGP